MSRSISAYLFSPVIMIYLTGYIKVFKSIERFHSQKKGVIFKDSIFMNYFYINFWLTILGSNSASNNPSRQIHVQS